MKSLLVRALQKLDEAKMMSDSQRRALFAKTRVHGMRLSMASKKATVANMKAIATDFKATKSGRPDFSVTSQKFKTAQMKLNSDQMAKKMVASMRAAAGL